MSAQATQTQTPTPTQTTDAEPPATGTACAGAGSGAGDVAAPAEVPELATMVDFMTQTEQAVGKSPVAKAQRRAAAGMSILDALERHHFWDPCLPAVLAGGKTMKTLADAVLVAGSLIVPAPEINPEAVMVDPAVVFARFLRQAYRFMDAIMRQLTGYEQLHGHVKRILQCVAPWAPSGARANALARQQAQTVLELVSTCTLPALRRCSIRLALELKTEYLWAAIRAFSKEDAHAFMQAQSPTWFQDVHNVDIVGVALKPEAPAERARLFTELLAAAPKFDNGKGITPCVLDAAVELMPLLSDDLLEQLVVKGAAVVLFRNGEQYFKFVLALVKAKPAMKPKVATIVMELVIPTTCKPIATTLMAELLL